MSPRPSSRSTRGATLLLVVLLVTVLLGLVAGVMAYASSERTRAVSHSRTGQRQGCAESGLQLARGYFGRNQARWNTFLSQPSVYDPVASPTNPAPANPRTAAGRTAIKTANPALFADLDGDGQDDVYLYIRDNEDEFKPLAPEWDRDNDQQVVVGALCISETLIPRRGNNNQLDPTALAVEGLLQYNGGGQAYTAQTAGGTGSGNLNR
jgi:type II secretory pathway pseudopilin PulG